MNDPEAESKNAPQEEKIPAWFKWLLITSFLFVVGVVLWFFLKNLFGLILSWLFELFANWLVESWRT